MTGPCTIVIPCYNEASRFPLGPFTDFVRTHPHIQFLLVNDGSKDNTIEVLRKAQVGFEGQVGVLDQPVNRGKGEAVRAGILTAMEQPGCEYVGFWDADLATPLAQIDDLSFVLIERKNIVMVVGARVKLLGRKVERRTTRHYLGRIFATVVSVLLQLPIYDTQCGAKIFRVSAETKALFAQPFGSRWVFDVEIIARLIRERKYDMRSIEAAIYEYPLPEWRDVAGSQVRPKDFFRAFFDVLSIYRRYLA